MIRAKHTIRHNNVEYKNGAIIDGLSEKDEHRLVTLKSAEYVLSPQEEIQKQRIANEVVTIGAEEFNELQAALDENYNAEELKKAAKEVGVDLTGLTRKDDIIEAVINQGKADELLEDEEPGELDD